MFTLSGIESSKQAAKTVMALETLLASNHMKKEKTRDMVALYNKIPLAELTSIMADFNWQGYLTEAGINDIDGVVITQLEYQKAQNDIIKYTRLKDWQFILLCGVINANSTTLSKAFDDEHFFCYPKVLTVVEPPLPDWPRWVSFVNTHFAAVGGKCYV